MGKEFVDLKEEKVEFNNIKLIHNHQLIYVKEKIIFFFSFFTKFFLFEEWTPEEHQHFSLKKRERVVLFLLFIKVYLKEKVIFKTIPKPITQMIIKKFM